MVPARPRPASASRRRCPSRPSLLVLIALALLGLAAGACTSARPPRPGPSETGFASWYGPKFHGKRTSSGETYDMYALTAAHRKLPFGTVVEVRNLANGRRVRVTINDRGPFVRRRVIDLSYAAAKELEMVGPGTAKVELRVVDFAASPPFRYTVQVGAFLEAERAEALWRDLLPRHPDATVRADGTWHRVQVGEFDDRRGAERLRRDLAADGLAAVVVTLRAPGTV